MKSTLQKHINSYKHAFNGVRFLIEEEHNFRIHLILAVTTIGAAILFQFNSIEWAILSLTITSVIVSEIINTVAENLCDVFSTRHKISIKKIKDISAFMVLLTAVNSVIVAAILFTPKIIKLCS